jgi:hypothetical protein
MDGIPPEIKTKIDTLAAERNRTGKKPLTKKQRVQVLNEIYDGLLFTWRQSVIHGWQKGTGALTLQLDRARLELDSWGGDGGTKAAQGGATIYTGPVSFEYEQAGVKKCEPTSDND